MRNTIKIGDKVTFDSDNKVGIVCGWWTKTTAIVAWAHGRAIIENRKLNKA